MRVLYGVVGEGMGHAMRSRVVLDELCKRHDVQVVVSGRAYDYLKKALALRPVYPEALNNLGVLYLRTRRPQEAIASFEESIRVAPAYDQSYLNLARVYTILGDREKARGVLLELLKQHPDHPQAKELLAQLGQ